MKYENTILHGSAQDKLKALEADSVDCCITSPPYWALRDYKSEPQIWDAVNGCAHEWTSEKTNWPNCGGGTAEWAGRFKDRNGKDVGQYHDRSTTSDFCSKCNAWKGSVGLEPTFQLYIKHLVDIFGEVRRVLKKSGACWVNLGDTYNGHKVGNDDRSIGNRNLTVYGRSPKNTDTFVKNTVEGTPEKSLCLIPRTLCNSHGKELQYDREYTRYDDRRLGRATISKVNEIGYNQCNCNAGFDGGIVLDPFMGAGTVGLVALQNARNFLGIELNEEYIKMAMERLKPYLLQTRLQ